MSYVTSKMQDSPQTAVKNRQTRGSLTPSYGPGNAGNTKRMSVLRGFDAASSAQPHGTSAGTGDGRFGFCEAVGCTSL